MRAVSAADGLIIASPGYHGGISGLVKNALDYVEDLRGDARPYLDGRAVAVWPPQRAGRPPAAPCRRCAPWCTPCAVGRLRSAWRSTPSSPVWNGDGTVADAGLITQLEIVTGQVVDFAHRWRAPTIG